MTDKKEHYVSPALAAAHEAARALEKIGAIDKVTMRRFDKTCLLPDPGVTPDYIKSLRQRFKVSQAVFAKNLNVSDKLVSDWERGVKKPGGPATRLLSVIDKHGLDILHGASQD